MTLRGGKTEKQPKTFWVNPRPTEPFASLEPENHADRRLYAIRNRRSTVFGGYKIMKGPVGWAIFRIGEEVNGHAIITKAEHTFIFPSLSLSLSNAMT